MTKMTITIGFIGAGNMTSALVGGLLARGHQPQHLALADANTSHNTCGLTAKTMTSAR